MKKVIFAITLLILVTIAPMGMTASDGIRVNCEGGAILVEYKTSNTLFEQDADKRWPPASTTKMMTAIIAIEKGNLSDEVRFSEKATSVEGSKLGVKAGLRVSMYPLIEAMLVRSGNDAAVAIAEHISGSEKEFAKLMNQKARDIGMTNTNFMNASGLPDENQYTTARDLSRLAVYAMGREDFRRCVAKREIEFINPDGTENTVLISTNRLLGNHPLVDGIKTGFTNKAKYCLCASATFRDYRLVAVVLGADNTKVWIETARLLDFGFKKQDPLYPLYREFDIPITQETITPRDGE